MSAAEEGTKPLPEGWKWARLGDVCQNNLKKFSPTPDASFHYIDISSIDSLKKRIHSPQKIMGSSAPSRARQIVEVNDILVATTRPNLNAVAKVENEHAGFVASTGFCVLRPNEEIDPDFLFFFTQSEPFIEKLCKGVNGAMYPAVNDSWLFR